MKSAVIAGFFGVFGLLWIGVVGGRAEEDVSRTLRQIVAPQELLVGDIDGAVKRWSTLLDELLDDPLLELALIRMRGSIPYCVDASWLEPRYRELLEKDELSPSNRELLRQELGFLLLRSGKREELDRLALFRDRLTHWRLVGPFGFQGGSLHVMPFPPEEEIDLDGVYSGFDGEVRWVEGNRLPDRAGVSPFRYLHPTQGCVYGLNQLQVEGDGAAVLHVETQASIKVWFNDELVVDAERLARDEMSRWYVPVSPRQGWNRVLVKLSGARQPIFSVRLLTTEGKPMTVTEETGAVVHEPGEIRARGLTAPGFDLRVVLDRLVAEHPEDPYVLAASGVHQERLGLDSRALADLTRACSLSEDPLLRTLLAEVTLSGNHLPAGYRKRAGARIIEDVLRVAPALSAAVQMKALWLHADDRSEEAIRLIRKRLVREEDPEFFPHVLLADMFKELGWAAEQRRELERARAIAPGQVKVLNRLAEFWEQRGRLDRSLELLEASLRSDASQTGKRRRRISLLRSLGRQDEAESALRELIEEDPDRIDAVEELADLLVARDRQEEALEIFEGLWARFPRYPVFARKVADLLWRMDVPDARERAWALYEKILEETPGYHPVRDLLSFQNGEPGTERSSGSLFEDEELVFSLFRIELDEILANAPTRRQWPTASSLAVFDDVIMVIYPDGSTRSETFQVFRIYDRRGIERHGTIQVAGEILDLKTIRPDGTVLEPITLSNQGEFTMPGLEEGATIVMRYFTRTPPVMGEPVRFPTFYFRDVDMSEPFVRSRYVVIAPESMDLPIQAHDFGVPSDRFKMGENDVHVFERRDMSAAKPERFMPDPRGFFPRVTVEQGRPYDEVASIYRRELLLRVRPTEELRTAARAVTAGRATDRERAEALYLFVRDHVQNEAGSSEATAALVTREGSRFFLFLALLRVLDIPFDYGRARPAPELDEEVDWDVVSENLFPERVARIRPRDEASNAIHLSENFELPFGSLPTALAGGPVLFVTGDGGRRESLPTILDRERMAQANTIRFQAQEDGTGFRIDLETRIPAVDGFDLKRALRTMDGNRRRMIGMSAVSSRFPGALFRDLEMPGLEDDREPFRFVVKAFLPVTTLEPVDGARAFRLPFEPLRLTDVFASGRDRLHPVDFKQYDLRETRLVLELGSMFSPLRLPEDLSLESELGRYDLTFEMDGDRIVATRSLKFRPGRVEPEAFPELMEFCRKVDEREGERILLGPGEKE